MTNRVKKTILFTTIGILTLGVIGTGVGLTVAKYTSSKKANQAIGYQGKLTEASIFFNANIWDIDGAIMYLYAYDNDNPSTVNAWIQPTRVINPTIDSVTFNMYIFRYDPAVYDHFNFVRVNPSGPAIGTWDWTNHTVWNCTKPIEFTESTTVNYYCIEKWDNVANGDGHGHATCGFTTHTISADGSGNLSFTGTYSEANLNS